MNPMPRWFRWVVVGAVAAVVVVLLVFALVPPAREWMVKGAAAAVATLLGVKAMKRGQANAGRRREVEEARRTVELNTAERNERIADREQADAERVATAPTETAVPEGMTDEQRAEAERLRGLW